MGNDPVALLSKLVSIDSIYPNERKLAIFLEKELKKRRFSVSRQKISSDRFNLLAVRGDRGKPIMFYGHMDTVPIYGKWKTDPFALCEKGDHLVGLGAWDMKSGIAAILSAVDKVDDDRRIKIVFGVDEENISEGAQAIIKSRFLDDVDGVIVTEAGNSGNIALGPRMVTLGRRGRAVYLIEVSGQSAHGASGKGINAALVAARIVQTLEKQKMRSHKLLPKANQFVRKIHSEVEGLTIPDKAIIELDRHLVPPETFESVLVELNESVDSFRAEGVHIHVSLKERRTPYLLPYVSDRNDPFVRTVCEAVKARYKKVAYNYGLSVADENVFAAAGLPVATIGPVGDLDHSADEWVSKKSFLELIDVLRIIIR